MCIVHKGFRGFRAVPPALFSGGKLIDLKPAIPYDTIHSTLWATPRLSNSIFDFKAEWKINRK
jgi:hypothetical protein